MKNSLRKQIVLNDMTPYEFGKLAFPEMEDDKKKIQHRVWRYCQQEQIKARYIDRFCEILKCDYNQLLGYEKSTE